MSRESMFHRMKSRITNEVNMAADRLQNIPIVDQLASSINLQRDEMLIPEQRVPDLPAVASLNPHQSDLIDRNQAGDGGDDEELNSDTSPQHQLFNGQAIKSCNSTKFIHNDANQNAGIVPVQPESNGIDEDTLGEINFDELSSDIEDCPLDDSKDEAEIDLLTDKPINCEHDNSLETTSSLYKDRYKTLVRAIRRQKRLCDTEKVQLENQQRSLEAELLSLRNELSSSRASTGDTNSNPSTTKNIAEDRSSTSSSPQPISKVGVKIKDLEKLLAKCKESLKAKNSQIKFLKDELTKVEHFTESFQKLKFELLELRTAHETWTVSIAENKRITHQEIEIKNNEIDKLKAEIVHLNTQLKDSNIKSVQLKSSLQDLESRMVSTSAAHQKERESLKKELTVDKINSLKQMQKDHDLKIERVKLELEKAVEALKSEILTRDEQLIKLTETVQDLQSRNHSLQSELDELVQKDQAHTNILEGYKSNEDRLNNQVDELKKQAESRDTLNVDEVNKLRELNKDLQDKIESLYTKLSAADAAKTELESKLQVQLDDVAPSSTEFEYLKNIVYQFMLGKEPLVLARVISAVFKFDKNQIEQVCKAQESLQSLGGRGV